MFIGVIVIIIKIKEIIVNINSFFFSYRVFEKISFNVIIIWKERSDINEFNCWYCRTS